MNLKDLDQICTAITIACVISSQIIKNDRIATGFTHQKILASEAVEIDTKMGGELGQIHEIKYTFGRPSWTKLPLKNDEKLIFALNLHVFQFFTIFTIFASNF